LKLGDFGCFGTWHSGISLGQSAASTQIDPVNYGFPGPKWLAQSCVNGNALEIGVRPMMVYHCKNSQVYD